MAGMDVGNHWRNRYLVWQLTKREVVGRYRGSALGLVWSIVNPLMMLMVYTFVFSVVFKARWDIDSGEARSEFAIILFAGLILNNFFAECVNRAPTLIVANVNFVKKIVFPLQLLPIVSTLSALFHLLVSIAILLLAEIVLTGSLPWTIVGLPLLIVPLFVACVGIGWLLASVGAYIRDIAYVTGLLTTIALFVSPVFYPVTAVPPSFRFWIELNPLTFVFETGRGMLVQGLLPDVISLAIFWLGCIIVGLFGFYWFERTKRGFADVL